MGKRDVGWKEFFSDRERYADVINGIGCCGEQIVAKDDLLELDTQSGNGKARDLIRMSAFGINFAMIGFENQEQIDYSMPLRSMSYDVAEYEKQTARICKAVRKKSGEVSPAEYLCGFRKESRLFPVITFVLYYGKEEWNGAYTLHEMLDVTGVPEHLKEMVQNYKMNLVEVRKIKDTGIFKTDVKQVFDFIRCSADADALKELVENEEAYRHMAEDAFDIAVQYTKATELIQIKDYHRREGKLDMCEALTVLIEQGKADGEQRVNKLIRLLMEDSRTDEIERMVNDREYQQKLFDEFGI